MITYLLLLFSGKHSPPDTAHRFGLTLFSPRNSSLFYLRMVCTYSPPETAHLEWFVPILPQGPYTAHLEKPGTYYISTY